MILKYVEIEGFRSIKERLALVVEPQITIVLGANDHGKSNLLRALTHLNYDGIFDLTQDINWDYEDQSDAYPLIRAEFELSELDRKYLEPGDKTRFG